jgi:hypothetical protein
VTLKQTGPYFLASDRLAQNVALLSSDMNLLAEWKFGRGGSVPLIAQTTPKMITFVRKTGIWMIHDLHKLATSRRPELENFLVPPVESKTFIGQKGQKLYAMSYGQSGAPTSIKAVLLPVVEGDQVYSGADLSGFAAFMHRTVEAAVRDYYNENSFGLLDTVTIQVFGVDVGPSGGPLKLPRKKLTDYFYPDYLPARVELIKNGVTSGTAIVFDGRESLTIDAQPLTNGPPGGSITFPFYSLAWKKDINLFPVQIKFLGTETLSLNVTTPAGNLKSLDLVFPAKTIDIPDPSVVKAKLDELKTYLDGVMHAAEVTAGIANRLFNVPNVFQIKQIGKDFGRLLVTFSAADTTGKRLSIQGALGLAPGGDPVGLMSPILGTLGANNTFALNQYMENTALLAQDGNPNFGYTNRILNPPESRFDPGSGTLITTISISDRYGGPGAQVSKTGDSGLDALFDTATPQPNSATTKNHEHEIRDFDDFLRDAFSAAIDRLRGSGQATDKLKDFGTVMVMPVEPPTPKFGVLPSENWSVTELFRPFYLRGEETHGTVQDRKDNLIQLQGTWALVFMKVATTAWPFRDPDDLNKSVVFHELGHALGFGDLYYNTGYRDELAYMDTWAMMANDGYESHHCGYHKLQANWIPDGNGTQDDYGRVFPIEMPDPKESLTKEILLVPIELWRDSLVASAHVAFGLPDDVPVAQLVWLNLGGDGSTFVLIEARQHAKNSAGHLMFSKNLPGDGGILITNGIRWNLDDRFAVNNFYRRSLQLLNPNNILRNKNDVFDLALSPELSVKGTKVEVLDRKTIEGDTEVYRINVSRENAEFIDLYFDQGNPYYKSPDLWVDWWGNNIPKPENLNPDYPLGQPTDQGEIIYVPNQGAEPHWMVARIRNQGKVEALEVKLNFYYLEPPGGGDGGKPLNTKSRKGLQLIGSITQAVIPGDDTPQKIPIQWNVPAGFSGHTCLLVEVEDYKIPRDSNGAKASDDVWQVNNHAQKNVDKFQALSGSPFAPVEFDFSVYNAGVCPERAYLEPDGLPYGMTLTVTPPRKIIASGETAIFHCKLELNEEIIRTGCENDQRFRIHAWRQDPESAARWGGVEYEVQPRERTAVSLSGSWDYSNQVSLTGKVTPIPGGGRLSLRLGFDNQQSFWTTVPMSPVGAFSWSGQAPAGSSALDAVANFEGNRKFGNSRSAPVQLRPPPPIK